MLNADVFHCLINDLIGLDALAIAKRAESQHDGGFKVPKQRPISIAASAEDDDKSECVVEESGHGGIASARGRTNRRYRETTSETSHTGISFIYF